jgi:hypothetical protein
LFDHRPPDLALIGRASVGKDTVADYLVAKYGYVRLAFADPLRELAEFVDPVIGTTDLDLGGPFCHYVETLAAYGYRETKDRFPEARHFLDRLGRGVRQIIGESTWVDLFEDRLEDLDPETPVVVTDCRFPNEADLLADGWDFDTLRLTRKAAPIVDAPSEVALDDYATDLTFANDGTVADLHAFLDRLVLGSSVLEAHE